MWRQLGTDQLLNLLKQERSAKVGIQAKRKKAGWDFYYLTKVLSQWNAIALSTRPGQSHLVLKRSIIPVNAGMQHGRFKVVRSVLVRSS